MVERYVWSFGRLETHVMEVVPPITTGTRVSDPVGSKGSRITATCSSTQPLDACFQDQKESLFCCKLSDITAYLLNPTPFYTRIEDSVPPAVNPLTGYLRPAENMLRIIDYSTACCE